VVNSSLANARNLCESDVFPIDGSLGHPSLLKLGLSIKIGDLNDGGCLALSGSHGNDFLGSVHEDSISFHGLAVSRVSLARVYDNAFLFEKCE
jgi:hypothetical protein